MKDKLKKFFHVQRDRLFYLYHRLRNAEFFWHLLNRRSRGVWLRAARRLSSIEHRVVHDLRQVGIASVPLREFFPDRDFFTQMSKWVAGRFDDQSVKAEIAAIEASLADRLKGGRSQSKLRKDFWVNLWPRAENGNSLFMADNPFLEFLLSDSVLQIVSAYLGSAPRLKNYSVQRTFIMPTGSPEFLSQRWHRDPEDKRMLKVFIYLSEVDETGAGPFNYVFESQLGGRWRWFYPQRLPVGRYPEPGVVEKHIPESFRKPILAPAGTVIFCDTSGLHKGGYSTTKNRTMFFSGFTSVASVYPISFVRPQPDEQRPLAPLGRYAVSSL
ncbi:MAG: hypothetical protein CEO19_2 [Parcubacteria group bacterium Gr01-1014_73]|nr:MAG: hypothetical protein CEO19_2 [Parcubacteria group bacterium Gr01-1014_73]